MSNNQPKIFFYLSQFQWFSENITVNLNTYLPFLNQHGICDGEYAWIIQTYLNLKNDGFPCELTGSIPEEGIVLAHHNSLSFFVRPNPRLLLIYLKADKPLRPYAQLQVVQNSYEVERLIKSYYIPHWPIPGLIPRDLERGNRFETVAYFGTGGNLAPELLGQNWKEDLANIGLKWKFKGRNEWNDYSDIDAVLAVRKFNSLASNWDKDGGAWKPPTKLYNSWLAGVPAILGNEPAYRDQRQNEFSYIEVNSRREIFTQLERLRDDIVFRKAIEEQGRKQSKDLTRESIIKRWKSFLIDVAVPAYEQWVNMPSIAQKSFLWKRYLGVKYGGIKQRTHSFVKSFTQ